MHQRGHIHLPVGCPFPHAGQARILADPTRHQIVRCGRRYGKTKLGLIAAIHTLAGPNRRVGWFAPQFKFSGEAWQEFTWRLKPAIVAANAQDHVIRLRNGASVEVWHLDDNPDAGRSRFYDLIVIDEAGLVPNLRRWWDLAARATLIDRRGRSLWLSTPNVLGPDFDDLYDAAASQADPEWRAHRAETFDNPHLPQEELEVIRGLRHELPAWLWDQEYLAIPAPSAGGFFDRAIVRRLRGEARPPDLVGDIVAIGAATPGDVERIIRARDAARIEFRPDPAGPWKLWLPDERPDQTRPWCFGVDLGAGVGAANTVFSVGDALTRAKVAEYATPGVTPERAAPAAALAGIWFGGAAGRAAFMQFEINGGGEVFARSLIEMGYPNLAHQSDHPGDVSSKDSRRFGWRSTEESKRTLLSTYRGALHSGRFRNPSDAALAECLTFRYTKSGRIESVRATSDPTDEVARIPHGDRTVADALLWDAMLRAPAVAPPAREAPAGSPQARVEARRKSDRRTRAAGGIY